MRLLHAGNDHGCGLAASDELLADDGAIVQAMDRAPVPLRDVPADRRGNRTRVRPANSRDRQ